MDIIKNSFKIRNLKFMTYLKTSKKPRSLTYCAIIIFFQILKKITNKFRLILFTKNILNDNFGNKNVIFSIIYF